MQDLIKRIEAADGPSRELDWAIYSRINGLDRDMEKAIIRGAFNYTSSIDAAMTLVANGWEWSLSHDGIRYVAEVWVDNSRYWCEAATPALALCAAALRARNG